MPHMLPRRSPTVGLITFTLAASLSFGSTVFADSRSDCRSGDINRMVKGCAELAQNSKTPKTERVEYFIRLGVANFARTELTQARSAYESALRLDPTNALAHLNLADLELNAGDLKRAIDNYNKAIDGYGKALQTDPNNASRGLASSYIGRGNALYESGKFEIAIADYDEALKYDSNSAAAFNGRGKAWRENGKIDKALADFNQAIATNPDDTVGLISRANVYADKRDWENAFKDYNAALEKKPEATAYNNRGAAYLNKGDLDRALEDFNRALEDAIKHDHVPAAFYYNRALVYHLKGELDLAIADYTLTIRRDSEYAYAFRNRGAIYVGKGEFALAIGDFTQTVRINAKDADGQYFLGLANLKQGNSQKAVDALIKSVQLDEKNSAARSALGEAYAKLGKYDDARAAFEKAIALDPVSADAYFQRGLVWQAQGDLNRARADYQEALNLNPKLDGARAALEQVSKGAAAAVPAAPPGRPLLNRVALVIGNSDYQKVGRLPNPARDAIAVATAFRQIGFKEVRLVENQTRSELLKSLRDFRDIADHAEWATIYYAGHGIEINGENYLVPVDARLVSDRDVPDEAIPLSRFLTTIDRAKQLKMVILDACRDNPFLSQMRFTNPTRSIGRGLARIEEPPGGSTLIAYAAKSGQIAQDGSGSNSPFVRALLERFQTPGLEVEKAFRLIRDDVLGATDRQQEPSYVSSLGGDDYIINPEMTK